MKKRLISGILASVCAITAMSFSAFADITDVNQTGSVSVTSTVNTGTISVTLPTQGFYVANPYCLKVTDSDSGASNNQNQIISAPFKITSASTAALEVYVSGTAKIGGEVTLLKSAPTNYVDGTKKEMFLFLKGAASGLAIANTPTFAEADSVVIQEEFNETKIGELAAKTTADTELMCQFGGGMNKNPTETWTAKDKVDVNLVFSFKMKKATA